MSIVKRVGIHGVGVYLPEIVRQNDWWPAEIVQKWAERQKEPSKSRRPSNELGLTEGMSKVRDAMAVLSGDPFKGAISRRVMPDGMKSSEMEASAARDALAHAGIEASEINMLLLYSGVPDYLTVSNSPAVHHALRLPRDCFSIDTNSVCTSFLNQFILAEQMILGGRARYALLVQSWAIQRLVRIEDEFSPFFGDAATAVVVGPVSGDHGALAHSYRTDGTHHRSLVTGCPGKSWWNGDGADLRVYIQDRSDFRRMLMSIPDMTKEVVDEALERAGARKEEVDYYATHQSAPWSNEVTRNHAGLVNARHIETFSRMGNVGAANVPLSLAMGERERLLKPDDLVVMCSVAAGYTWSCSVIRWGR